MKKGDTVIIVSFVLLCIGLFAFSFLPKDELTAVVTVDGEVKKEVVLSEIKEEYTEQIGDCVIMFSPLGVSFTQSDCKDKLCIKHGLLKNKGDVMACVPNKTVVALDGKKNFDGVAY